MVPSRESQAIARPHTSRWNFKRLGTRALPYAFIAPTMICLVAFVLYPIVQGLLLSFRAVKFAEAAPFIGLGNYVRLIESPGFWKALVITLVYTFFSVVGTFAVALSTALLVNSRFSGRTVARALITLPWAIPEVASVLTWTWMFDYQYGVINYLLKKLHLIEQPVQWLLSPHMALVAVLIVTIWKVFPLSTLVLLSGLQAIPEELYEAALIDGAGRLQQFRHVTMPGLRSIASILLLLSTIWSLRRFTIIWVMTQGGPMDATQTLAVGVYRHAFNYFDMGYAAAMGTVGFVLSIILSLAYFYYESRVAQ